MQIPQGPFNYKTWILTPKSNQFGRNHANPETPPNIHKFGPIF